MLDERRQFLTGIARPDLKTHINAQHPPNTHHANGLRHEHPLAHTTRPGLPESIFFKLFVRGRRLASRGRPMEAQQHGALSTPAALNMGGPGCSLKLAAQSTPLLTSEQKKQWTLNHQ